MTASPSFVAIPRRLNDLLSSDSQFHGAVLLSLNAFAPWISDNKLPFFPEFTDHGPRHIEEVLATAVSIITDRAWDVMTAADAAALTLSVLLHDSAMHLTEDGFVWLIQQSEPGLSHHGDLPWSLLWQMFLGEVSRWDERRIEDVFGHRNRPRRPPNDPSQFTIDDRRLIGEFVRRYHARLAHEIAIWGIPGVIGRVVACQGLQEPTLELIGLIARSHNLPIRRAADFLDPNDCRDPFGIHAPFLMGILRIADYLQIHAERAPGALLLVRSLRSPISSAEWRTHLSVQAINNTQNDPEAIYVRAVPSSASIFLKLRSLLDSIQTELDETWATLGEIYGRFGSLSQLSLGIRRIRSNIDDVEKFGEQVSYIPRHAAFASAGAELLKLLIKPLYGDQPEIGIRELVQNAVDAVRERFDLDDALSYGLPVPEVTVDLVRHNDLVGEIIVIDQGVGMTADVITNFFLKAGASFRRSLAWRQQHTAEDGTSRVLRSGRFGIGALAAFLLGERIEVTTRHVSEPRGIFFGAHVDDTVVELERVDCEVGTTIRISITDKGVLKRLATNPETWDWYRCATPTIRRTIDAIPIPSGFSCPDEGVSLPSAWRRIIAPDYNDVHWTYSLGNRPTLLCNGILIGESARRMATARYRTVDVPLYRGNFAYLTVVSPSVSVFDAEANLPLNLQRSELSTPSYPFQNELLTGVLTDFVAFALVNAPNDPRQLLAQFATDRFEYIGVSNKSYSDLAGMLWLWFWHTPSGLALSDPWSFGTLRPSRIILLQRLSHQAIGAASIPFEQEFVVPLDCQTGSLKDTEIWLRWISGETRSELGAIGAVKVKGAHAIVTEACIRSLSLRLNSKRYAWVNNIVKNAQQLSDSWYLITLGAVGTPALDYEAIAREHPATFYEGIAEVYLDHATAQPATSATSKVWRDLIGSPIIPYDVTARQRIIERLPNCDDIRVHQEKLRAKLDRAIERSPGDDRDQSEA
jgi:hypothetical protein